MFASDPKQKFTLLRLPGQATSCLRPGPPASLTFKTKSQGCDHVAVMCATARPAINYGTILGDI
jgi:hypothetical protein